MRSGANQRANLTRRAVSRCAALCRKSTGGTATQFHVKHAEPGRFYYKNMAEA